MVLLLGMAACQGVPPGEPPPATPSPIPTATPVPVPTATPSPVPTATPWNTCPQYLHGDLTALYQAEMDQISRLDDLGMAAPDHAELEQWREIIRPLAAANLDGACASLKQSGFPYQILDYTDISSGERTIVLREASPHSLGWGAYLFNPNPRRDLVLEAPHPDFDKGTENEALRFFQQTGAAALLVAGTNRCASGPSTPKESPPCSPSHSIGPSDVAHLDLSAFQAAHEVLLSCSSSLIAVQLHGHDRANCPDVFISNTLDNPGKLSNALEESVQLACPGYTVGQPEEYASCTLIGAKNVQGASVRACSATGERFFQIEQSQAFRQNPACLTGALATVFPEK